MNILLAWELGANLGHLGRQLPIALALREQGHTPIFAVADTALARRLLTPNGLRFVQAPVAPEMPRLHRPPASYDEILLGAGFHEPSILAGRVQAWMHLYDFVQPHAMLADHAPTALLAARLSGVPRVAFGSGFEIPPTQSPHPCFRPWEDVGARRLRQAEQRVLVAMNEVCREHGYEPLAAAHELFAGAVKAFATLPELDHYGIRKGERYLGPIFSQLGGRQVVWPDGEGGRVLAYLRPNVPGFAAMVRMLEKRRAPSILVVPAAPHDWIAQHSTDCLAIYGEALDLTPLLEHCDVGVSYGGNGSLSQFLLAGVAQLALPGNVEQSLGAMRMHTLGAGLMLGPRRDELALTQALDGVSEVPSYAKASQATAARYAGFTRGQVVEAVVRMLI